MTTSGRSRVAVRWGGTAALLFLVACVVPFGAFLAVEIAGGANTRGRPLAIYFIWALVVPVGVVAVRAPSSLMAGLRDWALASLAAHALLVVVAIVVLAL